MRHLAVTFFAGLLFAVGLGISGMTHPAKVLGFLDFAGVRDGTWDPSLGLVMAGGVLVNLIFFRIALRRGAPLLAPSFSSPTTSLVDGRLLGGAALFGVGWGVGGFCPGPAIVSCVTGAAPVVAFVVAMLASMAAFDFLVSRKPAAIVAEPEV